MRGLDFNRRILSLQMSGVESCGSVLSKDDAD